MNGIELCQRIRKDDYSGYIYVILLTSHDGTQKIVEGMNAGADDFISKPFEPAELLVRVRAGERVLSLETRDMAIFAMAKLAESRDPETGSHLERVRSYSRTLAEQLAKNPAFAQEVDARWIHLLYLTSPLHDIGKVGIPDGVLLKPGKLTAEEFNTMKRHTLIGAETLDAARAVSRSQILADGPRHHDQPPRALRRQRLSARIARHPYPALCKDRGTGGRL